MESLGARRKQAVPPLPAPAWRKVIISSLCQCPQLVRQQLAFPGDRAGGVCVCAHAHRQDKKQQQAHLGQPQPAHLPGQLLRVSQCSQFHSKGSPQGPSLLSSCALEQLSCTSWETRHIHHPMSSGDRTCLWWQWVLLSSPRSKELSGPSGWALVTQLPLYAWQRVSSGLGARCWPGHEPYQLLLPAVLHKC